MTSPMPTHLDNPLSYCREKVAHELSSLHYATVFQPIESKAFWLGLFTLNHELRQACMKQLEAGLTQVKLGWWRNALASAKDNSNPHPVITAISRPLVAEIDASHWAELIEAVASSCEAKRFNTLADWNHMLAAELRPWLPLVAKRSTVEDPKALASLLEFWVGATQLCQILRLAKYLDDQFQPIPIADLAKHGVTAEQIKQRQHDEKTTALFSSIALDRINSANKAWKAMPQELRLFCRPLRALFRMRVAEFKLHHPGYALLVEQKHITPLKKFSTSWTTHVLRR